MSAISRLAALLQTGRDIGAKPLGEDGTIDAVLVAMKKRAGGRSTSKISEDQQLLALQSFWQTQNIPAYRDAYLVSWALHITHKNDDLCVLEDGPRLERFLSSVDGWRDRPSAYRRCYQGMMKGYFSYAPTSAIGQANARKNWPMFRDYLHERNPRIRDERANPDWVQVALDNKQLFGRDPCAPYVDTLLRGDKSTIDYLCDQLSISKTSWFLEKLVMAQVREAVGRDDQAFSGLLHRLLQVLAENPVLRDEGLILLLNRYAKVPGLNLHQHLRDLTVAWWGNPWLPSNETRWGGVTPRDFNIVDVVPGGNVDNLDKRIDIDLASRMGWQQFECLAAALWVKQGYDCYRTPATKDYGVDVVAISGHTGLLIQTKTSGTDGHALNWDAVKEVVAGEAYYQRRHPKVAFEKICLTNQLFNKHAQENADLNRVQLLDRTQLNALLDEHQVTMLEVERMLHAEWH